MHKHVRASHDRGRLKRSEVKPDLMIRGFNYVLLSEYGFDIISLRRFFSGCPVSSFLSSDLRSVEGIVEMTLDHYVLENQ